MLSLVIPAGGDAARLRCTLTCLMHAARAQTARFEVIVVNDGAEPEVSSCVQSIARQSAMPMQLLETPRRGRSAARNAGANLSNGRRILFIDADILLERDAIEFHASLQAEAASFVYRGTIAHLPWLAAFQCPVRGTLTPEAARSLRVSADDVCLLSSRTLSDEMLEDPTKLRSMARTTPFHRDIERWLAANPNDIVSSWIGCTGGQISVDRSLLERLGGFDEQMGLRWGAEDLEFGYRASQAGTGIRLAEHARCFHLDHTTGGRAGDHDDALQYFAEKHNNYGVLRLRDYFAGQWNLMQVLEACHATA